MFSSKPIALGFIAFQCCAQLLAQNGLFPKLNCPLPSEASSFQDADRANWKEQAPLRTPFSSTFLTPDHRTIIHYSQEPLNYLLDGTLQPVDYSPVVTSQGLSAGHQPYPIVVDNAGGILIKQAKGGGALLSYSTNCKLNGIPASQNAWKLQGREALMSDFFPGVDKGLEFHFNAVEYSYIFKRVPGSTGAQTVIEERIDLPVGALLSEDQNLGKKTDEGWQGALSIRAQDGTELGRIRGAVCFDANKKTIPVSYQFENKAGFAVLKMLVPNTWLNDPARSYPVVLDPLVTGPTSTWGGTYIPSCLAPSFSADSILVTIPAGISVTGFFVSGSYYADPFTPALMSDGAMKFSTSCNSSTTFTVAPPTGSTPGTAYLTAFDLRSPLTCCFPQSCTAQSFYLRMHIQRAVLGTGCNTSYIYHDPFSGYPFSAYIEGRTLESFGLQWNVAPNSYCSDECNVNGTVYIKYGVPPYTITHPWAAGPIVAGTPAGCSYGTTSKVIPLTLPNCPWICDTVSMLSIPPPTVVDACGTVLSGLPNKIILIKEKPVVSSSPDPAVVCPDVPFSIGLNSCVAGATFSWTGNGMNEITDSIVDVISNSTNATTTTTYIATATANGCTSNPDTIIVTTNGQLIANFTETNPVIVNMPASFTDNSVAHGGTINSWYWDFGDGSFASTQHPVHTYAAPGVYQVCLGITTDDGCQGRECIDVTVIPAELVLPNVITPNGDGQNDLLYFKYLEFFGNNHLQVFDRWGKRIYDKENYANDWNAKGCSDGTYYYTLDLSNGKSYPGYVQIIHQP